MILTIKYIGTADTRTIRRSDFLANGISGDTLTWNSANRWEVQLKATGKKAAALEELLRSEGHFSVSVLTDERKDRLVVPALAAHTTNQPGTTLVDGATGESTVVR